MANAKVSTFTVRAANICTFTYAYVAADGAYGRVAVNAADGLAIYTGANFIPPTDGVSLGSNTKRWSSLYMPLNGIVAWITTDAVTTNRLAYTDGTGPAWLDAGSGNHVQQHSLAALTASRTVTWQDKAGTVAYLSDVAALSGDPQFFTPTTGQTVSPTATGDNVHCFIDPSGSLLALTLTLPAGTIKGQRLWTTITQVITTLTVTGTNVDSRGLASPTTASATSTFGWVWDTVSTKWNRFQ